MRISYWSSYVCSSDLLEVEHDRIGFARLRRRHTGVAVSGTTHLKPAPGQCTDKGTAECIVIIDHQNALQVRHCPPPIGKTTSVTQPPPSRANRRTWPPQRDRKSTRLNSSH